jgi:peptide chain release factor 2
MAENDFWNNQEKAKAVIEEVTSYKRAIEPYLSFEKRVEELKAFEELLTLGDDEATHKEFLQLLGELETKITSLEIASMLSGPHDKCNAIVSVHAGAGGTESCDWAELLLRMYTRWAERRGWSVELDEIQPGDEAGISRATFKIIGENAYGYVKSERGVHRLVRISPFDSNARRHTSFAAVDVVAEIEDIAVEIKPDDIKVDTYRSGGKGGQHVNKTESAVRITHLPTGIIAACQNERSQHQNRAAAMKILMSRLYEKMQDDKRSAAEKFYGAKGEIGWGSQIRSYVFQPYQMVKDLRTGVETGNVAAVMDGDIDAFVEGWLRAGQPRERMKNLKEDSE